MTAHRTGHSGNAIPQALLEKGRMQGYRGSMEACRINPGRAHASSDVSGLPRPRAGFTLIELMVVIGVIAVLAALAYPAAMHVAERSRINRSQMLVAAVAAAIDAYGSNHLLLPVAPALREAGQGTAMRRLWDVSGDGWLDGDPSRDPAFTAAATAAEAARLTQLGHGTTLADLSLALGYQGIWSARVSVDAASVDRATGRLLDGWGRPLRIAYDIDTYGTAGFGVWSLGPDGIDQDGQGDDIASFTTGE